MSGSDVTLRYLLFGEDKSASSSIKGVESTATRSQKVIGASFSKMGNLIGGEVGDLISRAGEGLTSLSESAKGMGPKLAAAGGAVAGLGAGLSILGSKDAQAQAQLAASVEATGHVYADYRDEIEKTIKTQENFGHTADDTQNALRILTAALGDPKKALDEMGRAANLAAYKHEDLATAAQQLAKVHAGATKILKEFGITATSSTVADKALTKAQTAHTAAIAGVAHAQRTLNDIQAVDAQRKKMTLGQEIQLRNAHETLRNAQLKLHKSHLDLIVAQDGVAKAGKNNAGVLDVLDQKIKGQASASVNSFSGHLDVLKSKLLDGASAFGTKFGPSLQVAGGALMGIGTILEIVRGRQAAAAVATDAETGAVVAQSVASKAAAAAQWLLNAAMTANPVGLIVAALIGLIAVFVLLYKHSTTFRNAMNAAFHFVVAAAMFAFDWIKQHWPLLLAILTGPFGIAVLLIVKNWSRISAAAGTAIAWIKGAWSGFLGFLGTVGSKIGSIASSMWSGIGSAFRNMINGIIDIWNSLHFSIPSVHIFGKTLGGGTIGVPHIPHLAHGGTLTRAGSVMVGENGPEYLHLPAGAQVRPLGAGPGGAGGDLGTLTLVVKGEDGRVIEQKLIKFQRQSGGRPLQVVTIG